MVLSGSLADDAGRPLGGETLSVRVTRESDPRDAKVAEGIRAARECDSSPDRPRSAHAVRTTGPAEAPEVLLVTDEAGRFCFRARVVPDRHVANLSWRGSNLVDAASRELAFDLSRQALVLKFDPTPRVVSLDEARAMFEATARVEDDGATHVASGLQLTLATERGELDRATTDASGRVRFSVDPKTLGPPGQGELRVSFAGNADTAFATQIAEIERHVKVTLRVPSLEKGELVAQNPEDGIPLFVDVSSTAGAVSEGGVEARIGDALVGAAPVERGLARLSLTFAPQGTEALVRLRYAPTAPWYEPLGEQQVRLPIRGPGLLSKAPILIAGLAVLAFFLIGRVSTRQAKPDPAPPKADAEPAEGRAGVEVVRAAPRGEYGWRGRVADAHDGNAVARARVWVERGSFVGSSVLARSETDAEGRFSLDGAFARIGDERIAAEADLHGRLVQPLPPSGELSIALVLRRRALLARLVSWAKRRGAPFDARPEPTPGHVRRAASADPQAARWADAIERAVFGEGEVDARAEGEIEHLAPRGPGSEPPPEPRDGGAGGDGDDRR